MKITKTTVKAALSSKVHGTLFVLACLALSLVGLKAQMIAADISAGADRVLEQGAPYIRINRPTPINQSPVLENEKLTTQTSARNELEGLN